MNKKVFLLVALLVVLAGCVFYIFKRPQTSRISSAQKQSAGSLPSNAYLEGDDVFKVVSIKLIDEKQMPECIGSRYSSTYDGTRNFFYVSPVPGGLNFSKPFIFDVTGMGVHVFDNPQCEPKPGDDELPEMLHLRLYDTILVVGTEFTRFTPDLDNTIYAVRISDTPHPLQLLPDTVTAGRYAIDMAGQHLYTSNGYRLDMYDISQLDKKGSKLLGSYTPNFDYIGTIDEIALGDASTVALTCSGFGLITVKLDVSDPKAIHFVSSEQENKASFGILGGMMRNEHGSSLNMVHYVAKEGVSLVDVGPSEKDARDDKVIIANLEDVVPRDLKDKIAKAAEGQPTRLRGMAFPRGSTKLMFYSEPVIGEGQGVFIKIDVAQSKPQFEWANINYQTTPRYDVPKSDDGRYAINVGKNLANTLGEGGEQELWIHDMVEDSSRQILQLNGKETLSSGFDVNGRECEANRFWPTWVKPHVMEFVVYEYAEPDNCDNHFKTLRTMQYDVDTSKMTSLTIGGVETLAPSPDGKYVAYRVLEKFVGCCGGPANIPFYSLWIMKSDGSGKVQVERPADVEAGRERVSFNGWYPDSSGIQYYYQEVTEATQASAIYRVGVDGKHPVIDKSAQYPWQKQGLF